MTWIVGDSFDYYGAVADLARSVWDSMVGPSSLGTGATFTRFGVGQSYAVTASAAALLTKTFPANEGTVFTALAFYWNAALSGTNPLLYIQYRDGATAQCTVVFESSGNLVLKAGGPTGTVLATYTGAFVQQVWTHFQIRVAISNTAGAMTVRKNGQPTDSFASPTNLDTAATANNYANVVAVGSGTSVGSSWYVDDLLIYSATAPAPNDWVGDIRAVCLMPSADTATKAFTVFPSGTNAGAVDEAAANSDTDYVFSSTVGQEDLYDVADLPTTPAAIVGVVTKAFVKKSDAGARNGQVRMRSGATDAFGADTLLSSTYTYLSRVDVVDPATGVAWTPAAVNAIQIGQKVTA